MMGDVESAAGRGHGLANEDGAPGPGGDLGVRVLIAGCCFVSLLFAPGASARVGTTALSSERSSQPAVAASKNKIFPWSDSPVWSPDGRSIAFVSSRNANPDGSEIWVMNADGSNQRRLTNNPGANTAPTWSPDGRMIAFVGQTSPVTRATEIYVMNADGSDQRQLTDSLGDNLDPVWSPDSSMIAFTTGTPPGLHCGRDGKRLYVMNADGSDQLLLVDAGAGPDGNWNPTWSPDGSTIAFDSDRDGKYVESKVAFHGCGTPSLHDIYLINADGSNLRQLTNNRAGNYRPVWSTDGKQISFSRGPVPYVMNADGSGQHPLTRGGDGVLSPDGTQSAFTTSNGWLYVMNADGSNRHELANHYVLSYYWSPDSRVIAYTTVANNPSGTHEIRLVNADGTKNDRRLTP